MVEGQQAGGRSGSRAVPVLVAPDLEGLARGLSLRQLCLLWELMASCGGWSLSQQPNCEGQSPGSEGEVGGSRSNRLQRQRVLEAEGGWGRW